MALLGSMAVAVLGDIKNLQAAFKETKTGIRDITNEAKRGNQTLSSFAAGIAKAGAAIIGAISMAAISASQYAEQIDQLATRTGIGVEELQGLAYAAKLNNVSMEQLGNVLHIFSRRISEAVEGNKAARDAFRDLDVEITTASGSMRASSDILLDVADRFAAMTSEADRARLAQELFGRSGAAMIPVLAGGREGLLRLMEEARRLGLVLSQETLRQLAQLDDNLDAIKSGLAGLSMQLAGDVAPAMVSFTGKIKAAVQWLHELPEPMRKVISQGSLWAGVFALAGGSITSFLAKLFTAKGALAAFGVSLGKLTLAGGIAGAVILALGLIASKLLEIKRNAELAKMNIEDMADLATLSEEEQRLNKEIKNLEEQIRLREQAIKKHQESIKVLERRYKETGSRGVKEELDATKMMINGLRKEIEDLEKRLGASQKRLNQVSVQRKKVRGETTGKGEDVKDEWNLEDYLKDIDKQIKAVEKLAEYTGDYSQVAADKARIYRSALEDLVSRGIDPTKTSLGNLVELWKKYDEEAASQARIKGIQEETEERNLLDLAMIAEMRRREEYDRKQEEEKKAQDERIKGIQQETEVRNLYDLAMIADMNRRTAAAERNADAEDRLADARKYLADLTGQSLPDWEEYARSLEELAASGVAVNLADQLRQLAAQIRAAGRAADETTWREALADMAEESLNWQDNMIDMAKSTAQGMQNAMETWFFDALTGQLDESENYFQSFLHALARQISQFLSSQIVWSFINNLFPGWSSFAFAGAQAGSMAGLTLRDTGGPVRAGMAYLINRAPEVFVPGESGTIIPRDRLAIGGANVQVNLINQSGVPLKTRQSGEPFFDGQKAVVSLIIDAEDRNVGGLRDRMQRR